MGLLVVIAAAVAVAAAVEDAAPVPPSVLIRSEFRKLGLFAKVAEANKASGLDVEEFEDRKSDTSRPPDNDRDDSEENDDNDNK